MNCQIALSIVFLLVSLEPGLAAHGGKVELVRFDTSVTGPVYCVPKALKKNESLFRAGLKSLPECLLVVGALAVGSDDLRLSSKQAESLTPLVTDVYTKINQDPAFRGVSSALPYCFSTEKHTTGQYFLYRPEHLPQDLLCIVFLHGYGGNFQFYTWVLKEEFPNAILLAPSWGVSWATGSSTYLKDMLSDAEHCLGTPLGKPWLMAISAGGPAGFRIYNELPATFSGYVCLASLPRTSIARRLQSDLKILMLNGTTDAMVPIALARKQAELARQAVPTLTNEEIAGNHFFLLSNQEETFGTIKAFMKQQASSNP